MISRRLGSLDALRAVLIGGVVVFHVTRPFDPFDYYVKAGAQLEALAPVVLFVTLWGMPLFFVLAGVAAWHSLGRRRALAFARERVARLLVPFCAGLVLLVPPQVHVERLQRGEHVSYLDTLSGFFDVGWRWELPLPVEGRLFEPAHLWFLAYLFVFTLLLLPVLVRLRSARAAALLDRVAAGPLPWLLGLGLLVALAEAALGSEEAGGWNRFAYPSFLLLGFLLAARPSLAARLSSRLRPLALAGLLGFTALALAGALLHDRLGDALLTGGDPAAVAWRAGKAAVGSVLLLALAGWALARLSPRCEARHASRLSAYASEAALPVYLLHQTVAVLLAYWVLSWPVAPGVQWAVLTLLTVATTLGLYELLRRPAPVRRLLGLRTLSARPARLGLRRGPSAPLPPCSRTPTDPSRRRRTAARASRAAGPPPSRPRDATT